MEAAPVSLDVLISDSDDILVRLLAADLRRQSNFTVFECRSNAPRLMQSLEQNSPDVLLLGLRSSDASMDVVATLHRVRRKHPNIRSVVLSDDSATHLVAEVFRAGVRGWFDRRGYDSILLTRCIQCVAAGQVWARNDLLSTVLEAYAQAPACAAPQGIQSLTPRELEVANLVADGLSNGDVAQELGLSIHTVKNYLLNVFDKLGVSNRAELVLYLVSKQMKTSLSGADRSSEQSQGAILDRKRLRKAS